VRPDPAPKAPRSGPVAVRSVTRGSDLGAVRDLFREYRQWHIDYRDANGLNDEVLKIGLGILDHEIASLPGDFGPPRGALVLARLDGSPVGCGALRPLRGPVGEIKRVYVRPSARGRRIGQRITRALLRLARTRGYERVVLDTLPTMTSAIALYRELGFTATRAYGAHPLPNALYFAYRLR
jgi:putative acetyltransferase